MPYNFGFSTSGASIVSLLFVGDPNTPDAGARDLSLERLVEQCRWDTFRGPGPGGQKRNKTSSAVRITHIPTGISAIATESRSQKRNKAAALHRLRRRIALELRAPPQKLDPSLGGAGLLDLGQREESYPQAMGRLLDVVAAHGGSISLSAGAIGVTTGRLVRFLQRDLELLAYANRIRKSAGLRPLGAQQK